MHLHYSAKYVGFVAMYIDVINNGWNGALKIMIGSQSPKWTAMKKAKAKEANRKATKEAKGRYKSQQLTINY